MVSGPVFFTLDEMYQSATTSRDVLHNYFNLSRKEKGQKGGNDWCFHHHDLVFSS